MTMGSIAGVTIVATLVAALVIAMGCIDRNITEAIQETASCGLMQKPDTGEISCFGCSGTSCTLPEEGWKVLSNRSERCVPTLDGCVLNNSMTAKNLSRIGYPQAINNTEVIQTRSRQWNAELDCKSDSMGLTVKCGHRLLLEGVSQNDWLKLGNIYTYKSGDLKIVHRLVACADERYQQEGLLVNCTRLVFHGDNNLIGEVVGRANVDAMVASVNYG